VGDDGDVIEELAFELGHVAHIVDAFVEAAGELGGDGLGGDLLVGDGGEDDEEFVGRLGQVRLVHRDLGDEGGFGLGGEDVAIELARLLDGVQVLGGGGADLVAREAEGATEVAVAGEEGLDIGGGGGLADGLGDVEGEEVAGRQEAVHVREIDVVGVDAIGALPAEGRGGGVGLGAHAGRLGADDEVLAVALVPHRRDGDALLQGLLTGGELRAALLGEAVAHAERESFEDHFNFPPTALTYQ